MADCDTATAATPMRPPNKGHSLFRHLTQEVAKMAPQRSIEIIRQVRDWGNNWGEGVQAQILEAGLARAQFRVDAGMHDGAKEYLEVSVPITVKLRYLVTGDEVALAADAGVQCSCTYHSYPEGGGVCICTGPGAGNDSCDCANAGAPIAMKQ
jgi:hypothetical protein